MHPAEAALAAGIVILGVPDDLVEPTATALAASGAATDAVVVHLSGSVPLTALDPVRRAGSDVLSFHPFQSFPDVETGIERLPGSGIALTARADPALEEGRALARDVGGRPFVVPDEVKPLYHAAAVFCANYLVTVEAVAERLLREAGVEDPLPLLASLARTSFDRTFALGPAAALTGPAVRADTGTISRNLRALSERAPSAVQPYVALARAAADVAEHAGRLDADARARVEQELARWT